MLADLTPAHRGFSFDGAESTGGEESTEIRVTAAILGKQHHH